MAKKLQLATNGRYNQPPYTSPFSSLLHPPLRALSPSTMQVAASTHPRIPPTWPPMLVCDARHIPHRGGHRCQRLATVTHHNPPPPRRQSPADAAAHHLWQGFRQIDPSTIFDGQIKSSSEMIEHHVTE
jgi:hypothetical protein